MKQVFNDSAEFLILLSFNLSFQVHSLAERHKSLQMCSYQDTPYSIYTHAVHIFVVHLKFTNSIQLQLSCVSRIYYDVVYWRPVFLKQSSLWRKSISSEYFPSAPSDAKRMHPRLSFLLTACSMLEDRGTSVASGSNALTMWQPSFSWQHAAVITWCWERTPARTDWRSL